jgi:nicotinic acid mononucleotide adenylyltransferase
VLPAISSTEVRARIGAGRWEELEPFVPRAVLAYARERGLFQP